MTSDDSGDLGDEDSAPGGIFRNRAVAPAPDQHQQTPDEGAAPQGATRPTGPVGLPRRRKPGQPTLVSDHGRRVDRPGPPRTGPPAAAGPDGLPRRVRQANLAPQLRGAPAPAAGPPAADEDERDADEVRSRMASLQRGWQRGRRDNSAQESAESAAVGTGPADTAPGTTSEGTGR